MAAVARRTQHPDGRPATDCVDGQSLLLSLVDAAPPIPITTAVRARDGGTVYVSPAEADAG